MDKRAKNILFDTYWSSKGWMQDSERRLSASDFEYAKSQGVMFDSVELTHDEAQTKLLNAIGLLDKRTVANAFLASLSTRRIEWRSAFGSYVVFQHMQKHDFQDHGGYCAVCGSFKTDTHHDLNILNFERLKWGGVDHSRVKYAAMDLSLFLQQSVPSPTAEDIEIFKTLLFCIQDVPNGTTSAALHKYFPKTLLANKVERGVIVELLGFCGILNTPSQSNYSVGFVPSKSRELPNRHFIDMSYPACWWSSDMGICKQELENYFGHVL